MASKKATAPVKALVGTTGDDKLVADKGITKITALDGFDTLLTQADGATKGVTVNLANGKLTNGFGEKVKIAGFEVVFGTDLSDTITGSKNADYLIGGGGGDKMSGGDGFDELYGMTGNDVLKGGKGSDYFVGGQGADKLVGGQGFDTADYSDEGGTKGIVANLAKGSIVDTFGDTDRVQGIERVIGSLFADQIVGSKNGDMLEGRDGADMLDGGKGNDTLAGGEGVDTIAGGEGTDIIDYSLEKGQFAAVVDLGAGSFRDTYGNLDVVSGVEGVRGSDNGDFINGSKGNDVLDGAKGSDVLSGGDGKDKLLGGEGDDFLAGGRGVDTIDGGEGIDAVDFRGDTDGTGIVVDMAAGLYQDGYGNKDVVTNVEIVKGTIFADKIAGSDATEYLDGWDGDDYLFGGGGADELYGARGNDTLEGGKGSDYLDGGLGDDVLIGGDSWDFIVLRQNEGRDTVVDFDAALDILDLRNTGWTSVDEARSHMEIFQVDNDVGTLIHLGDEGSMFLRGVTDFIADDRFVL